ncbi:hypothetical protein [Tautonia rosea]|uniref:hypothetical protein n=1 Tax=Tautonia rosea TaxID=2728037 RepID=UPI001475D750|nr:hypothetical protein [Tautonia rosea]
MGLISRPRTSIAGTSLCAVAVLGLSTGFAYLNPDGIDRLLGGGTGESSCSVSSAFPCSVEIADDPCCLMTDEESEACLVPEESPPSPPSETAGVPLDCCQGGASRGALLLASTSTAEATTPKADAPPVIEDDSPTFTRDVAPLLQKHCQECHRPGQIAPFPLVSYQDARKHAYDLATVTEDRRMPPWLASPDFGDVPFLHDRSLTEAEIATFQAWADAGMPEGNPDDLPPAPEFSEGWTLGEPDLIIELPEPFEIPADGADIYRCFVIPNPLPEDAEVVGLEYQPGNPRVVHHILGYIDVTGEAAKLAAQDDQPGYECPGGPMIDVRGDLGGWAPGANAEQLPDRIGRILPKGSHIILQVHYHPSGKPETDQSRLGLYLASKDRPIKKALHWWAAGEMRFTIPAGAKDYQVLGDTLPMPCDVEIHKVSPHMHLLGTDMTMYAETPSGNRIDLIRIDRWDFNWQLQYTLKQPVFLPAGSVVKVIAHFDNSTDNPNQPVAEPIDVRFGEATTDEMCFGFFAATKAGQDLTQGDTDDLHLLFRAQLEDIEKQMREERARRAAEARTGDE